MNFGENLRNLRKSKKLSQEKLAEKLEVSRQSISKWENGDAYPEMKNIMLLCEIFHCKINELVNEEITDIESMDEEIKQTVVKFKENQQKRMKLISKSTYLIAKVSRIVTGIVAIAMCIVVVVLPFILKDFNINGNTISVANKEIKYSIDDMNILTLDGEKHFIQTSTNLQEFIPNHSNLFYIIGFEYVIICFTVQVICLVFLFYNIEKMYKNIYEGDTPFTEENVKRMNFIAIFLGVQLLFPKISATIYSVIARLDLAIEYKLTDIVVILVILSFTYIFKYGYQIQLDSKGKIYGNEEK